MTKKILILIFCFAFTFVFTGCDSEMVLTGGGDTTDVITNDTEEDTSSEGAFATDVDDTATVTEPTTICVFVCGAVANEGVYELENGARVCDAIDAAGGLTEEADTTAINQADYVTDSQKLYFPTTAEVESGEWSAETVATAATSDTTEDDGKININTATAEELQTLTGIGESKAASIVSYRETNGNFSSIEDIKNVSGIGDSLYEQIKNNIKV